MATGSKAKGNYRPMAMLMYASAQRAGSVKRVLPKDQGQKAGDEGEHDSSASPGDWSNCNRQIDTTA